MNYMEDKMSNWNSIVVSLWNGKYSYNQKDLEGSILYRTFGNHDMISIKPVRGNKATETLQDMWRITDEYSKKINAGESIHNLFAMSDDSLCDNFWNTVSKYIFVSALQIKFNSHEDFEKQLLDFKSEIETICQQRGLVKNNDFVIYDSIDCGDVLLFLKTNQYITGADLIFEHTIKSTIKHYGYSFCGLNSDDVFYSSDSQDEIIPKVVVCSVLADASNYNNWFSLFIKEYPNQLKKDVGSINKNNETNSNVNYKYDEYVHFARLGNEDICINIYNCRMSHFYRMLFDDNGVFSNENILVKAAFSRLRIHFDSDINDIIPYSARGYSEGKSIIKEKTWESTLEATADPAIYKALSEVFAACENLEIKEFAYDVVDCIRNVFPIFFNKIEEYKNKRLISCKKYNNDLILFVSGLMSIAEGSLHSDKLFINVPGFNAVPCDAPSKLLAYYTSYIQKLVSVLNDTNNHFDYRFFLCPDLYLGIEVVTLFNYQNSESQLLKARIPIKRLFEPNTLLLELSHEAAHFVGNEIRCRNERVEYLADILSYLYAERILQPKKLVSTNGTEINGRNLEEEIMLSFVPESSESYYIYDLISNEWKDIFEYIKNKLYSDFDFEQKDALYLDKVKQTFQKRSMNLFVDNEMDELKNKIYDVIIKHVSDIKNISDEKVYSLFFILERHINQLLLSDINRIIEVSCRLCSESFADLVMLFITADPQEYLYNIFQTEKNAAFVYKGKEVYSWEFADNDMKYARILSVLNSLGYKPSDIDAKGDSLFKAFLNRLIAFNDKKSKFYKSSLIGVVNSNSKYLSLCLKKIKSKESDLIEIRKLYHSTTKNNLSICMKQFRKCSFDFRKTLINECNLI